MLCTLYGGYYNDEVTGHPTGTGFTDLVSEEQFYCALDANGTADCWDS